RARAGVLLGAGAAGLAAGLAGALVRLLVGAGPAWGRWLLVPVAALVVGALVAASPLTRRARQVLDVCAVVVAGAVLTSLAVAVAVLALGRLPRADEERVALLAAVLGGAVAVLAARPVVGTATEAMRRLVGRRRHSPWQVLATFGERASRGVPLEELLRQLCESLRASLALSSVQVWTLDGDRLVPAMAVPSAALSYGPSEGIDGAGLGVLERATVAGEGWARTWLPPLLEGAPAGPVRIAPARHGGQVLGLVVARRPVQGEPFAEADERALGELAGRLGVVLHNAALDAALQETLDDLRRANAELRASRSRLVAAADAERRRIERDLHDGAQQHLVALAVNLGLARQLLTESPEEAGEVLAALSGDVQATIAELRSLAHGIYPPLLLDSGLAEALRAAAVRSPAAAVVRAEGVGRYPAQVEAAVYFCCLEALANAGKHAPGARVEVVLADDGGRLRFTVRDDGPGFDPAVVGAAGHGLVNMADRVGAVGGSVRWDSAPGRGTTVTGEVPVAERPAAAARARLPVGQG
ncbi:MAG: GAF domain-containing sensor histidine kinase, partial [Motilibacteraceae bacterium]